MLRKYFFLNNDCFLIKGALRGAIYNLNSGNVFSVNENGVRILEMLDNGITLPQVLSLNRNITKSNLIAYLKTLQEKGLGNFNEAKTNKRMEKIKIDSMLKYILHLELTTACNLRCLHCYNESSIDQFSKKNNQVSLSKWKSAIKDAYEMNCRRIQFIGGEPFLKRKLMFELINYAKHLGYPSIEVSSNGTLITNADFEYLKNIGVGLAFSFYSVDYQAHDLITTQKGSWNKTLNTIRNAVKMGIPLRVSVVAMKQNEKDIKRTVDFLKSIGIQNVKSTAIEPSGRGCNTNLITTDILSKQVFGRPYFAKINKNIFWRNKTGHNCFMEQMCIGSDGSVYPCLAEREISYGNIMTESKSFREIFLSKTAKKIRGLSKDNIEICKDCEYRYCCFDCRVRAWDFLKNNFHSKPWWCSYNPYKGTWNNKETAIKGGKEKWERVLI